MRIFTITFSIILLYLTATQAQNIGNGKDGSPTIAGVVNVYTSVAAIVPTACNSEISVSTTAGFSINDLFLIIQMNGAGIIQANDSTYGSITTTNNCGNYEFAKVFDVVGNKIYTIAPLQNNYDVTAQVQVIRVPQYINPTVMDTLTCLPWNGSTGGILAIDVMGTLTLHSTLQVSGKGFRGGAKDISGYIGVHTGSFYYVSTSDSGAAKGEGIATSNIATNLNGRGAPANGGGGGNNHNGGGGGGANAGKGGNGGYGYQNAAFGPNFTIAYGVGGYDVISSLQQNKLIMGGGAGAGHANNINSNGGGYGGGIIFITANAIDGNNNSIAANGSNGANVIIDGAGGGGAGGSIMMRCNNFISPTLLYAKGGNGGGVDPQLGADHGPGGGGGGGAILFASQSLPFNITSMEVTGGYNGLCNGAPHGSTKGNDGVVWFNKVINLPSSPLVYTSYFDTSFCGSATLQLIASSGSNFVWTGAAGLSCSTCQSPQVNTATSATYIATVNSSSCIYIDSFFIAVKPLPLVSISSFGPFCQNSNAIQINQVSPLGGQFSGLGIVGNMFNPSLVNPGIHTIEYAYTDTNGCTNTDTAMVTVYSVPTVSLITAPVCINQPPLTLTGGSPWGGIYSGAGISNNMITATLTGVGTHMVTYTYADSNGCTNADSAWMTVFDVPQFTITAAMPVCANTPSFLLTTVSPQGGTYTGTGTSNNLFNPQVAIGANTINYHYTDGNGCSNDTSFVQVVNPLPLVNLASMSSVCASTSPFQLTGGAPLGGDYSGVAVSNNQFFPALANIGFNTIVYTFTDNNGCTSGDTTLLNVLPMQPLTIAAADTICYGMQTTMTASGSSQVQWWPSAGLSCNACISTIATPDSTVTYVLSSSDSCTVNDTVVITVIPKVEVNAGNDTAICSGEELMLSPISNYQSFNWNSNPFVPCLSCGTQWINPLQSSTYTVTVTNGYCSASDQVHVEVLEVEVEAMASLNLIVAGETVELSASGADAYKWEPALLTINSKAQMTNARPLQSTWFTVTGTTGRCTDTASVYVEVYDTNDGLFIPNAFTPNDDGQNEIFTATKAGDYLFYTMQIYNRWGKLVFESNHMQNGWDGTYEGEPCPAGEYFFQVQLKTARSVQNKNGKVLLIR